MIKDLAQLQNILAAQSSQKQDLRQPIQPVEPGQ